MSDLSNRLREHGPSFGLSHLCDEAADALDANDARIAELEAQLANAGENVSDLEARIAVDAQPVAIYQVQTGDCWLDMTKEQFDNHSKSRPTRILYASAQSEEWRKALTEIAEQERVELMFDPTWAQRIAIAALAQHTGEKVDVLPALKSGDSYC